jgi:hypothetical protein
MKRFIFFLISLLISGLSYGQITVAVTGSSNTTPNLAASYTSLANALTGLNAVTAMTGPVTLTLTSGTSETAPVKGFIIGSSSLNPVLSATNTITLNKSGAGAVTINAAVGTSNGPTATPDGMLYLNGADYVTIDGLTFTDGNTASATVAMEFGVALFKRVAGDGCNNNTIQNCTFNMQRINNASASAPMFDGSWAIYVLNSTAAAATTVLTPTNGGTLATNGTNSNNKFYSNTINNGNSGIGLSGYAASSGVGPAPTASTFLGDLNNDIGGTGAAGATTGNTILNFGGGAATNAAVGIRVNNQWSVNISNNTVNNNNGSGTNHGTTLRGIFAQAGTSANASITYNNVTIKGGATTSSIYAIDNGIGITPLSNTVNINNNTITGTYTTATTGTFYSINNTSTATTVNINNNTISNISTPGTGSLYGVYCSGASSSTTININSNNMSTLTKTGAAIIYGIYISGSPTVSVQSTTMDAFTSTANTTIYGYYNGSSSVIETLIGNTFSNFNSTSTASIRGIYIFSATGNKTFQNNNFYNFSVSGAGSLYGLYFSYGSTDDISGNKIYAFTGGAATVYGMYISAGTTNSIYKNKIYGLTSTNAAGLVYGMYILGGTTNNIYNNYVGDLSCTAFTTGTSPYLSLAGIYLSSGTTNNLYNNTVYIGAVTSSGANASMAGIYASTTPTTLMQNNLVVNLATPTGSGKAVAYLRSNNVLTTYSNSSNNNSFYGTSGLFWDGTTAYTTLANYKTAMSTRDQAALNANPTFASTTGANSNYLHITSSATPNILESAGMTVGLFAVDYDGDARPGPAGSVNGAGTAYDIGADEFDCAPLDLTPPTIAYTALANTYLTAARTLTATITDASGVPISGTGLPMLYWKINSGSYTGVQGISIGSNQYTFTFGAGVVTSDIVSYYVVAQDNAPAKNTTSYPLTGAATFTSDPPACGTAPTSPSTYTIIACLSGTKTVGTAGDYATITAAIADINSKALCGPLTLSLLDATYSTSETFPIVINELPGASATNTLTIKPAIGITPTISGAVASSALIKLNGADYIIIDGSNTVGGTTKNLTITNTATTAPSAIWLASLGTSTGCNSNTIKNCNLSTGVQTTLGYGVYVGGTTITSATAGADNDNITIQNNTITNCAVGIYANGTTAVSAGGNDNLNINGNSITYNSTLTACIGIQTGNSTNSNITQNTISVTTSGSTAPVGISIETGFVSSSVSRNNILAVTTSATGGWGGRGITIGTGTASSSLNITNNLISGINGSNYSSFGNSSSMGIAIGVIGGSSTLTTTTGGINLYNNTVNMSGTYSYAAACLTADLYVGSGASALDIRNNIFVNALNNTNGSGTASKNYAIYSTAANTAFTNINYNDYYVSGTQGILGYLTSDRTNLAGIIAGFGQNTNSVNNDPTFISTPVILTPTAVALDGTGQNGLVAVDYSNVSRSNPPDIGALEFTPPSCTVPTALATGVITGNSAVLNWTAASPAPGSGYDIYYSTSATAPDGATVPTATVAAGIVTYTTPATLTAQTTYYAWVRSNCGAGLTSNWTSSVTFTTPCANATLAYFQGFNAVTIPGCWSQQFVVGTSAIQYLASSSNPTTTPQESSQYVYWNSYSITSGNSTRLVSPPITTTGTSSVDVEFYWMHDAGYSSYTTEGVQVQYSLDGSTWINAGSFIQRYDATLTGWNKKTVTLPVGAGNQATIYVGFKLVSAIGNNCSMDAVTIKASPVMTYTSSTTTQGVVTSVNAGTTDQQVVGIQVVTTGAVNPLSLTKLSVNATGSTLESNITNAKIYYTGNSSTFAATGQFGSTLATPTLANFDVTGTQTLASGTNYFWLTYDIPTTAINGNVIDAQCTGLTISTVDYIPTVTAPVGTRTIANKTITSITGTQASTVNVLPSQTDKEVLKLTVVAAGPSTGSLLLNSINVNYTGTATSDIPATGVKLYATNPNTFATTTPIGTAQSLSAGVATFNSLNYNIPTGTSYLWVAFDIAPSATFGNFVDAKIPANGINVGGTTYNGTDIDPAGVRPIGDKAVNSVTITQASTSNITKGTNNNEVLMIDVDVTGTGGLLYLNSIIANYTGTVATDIAASGVKLYRTSTPTFATTNPLGTAQSLSASAATFNTLNYDLPIGHTYVWVTFDVPTTANGYNNVDASILLNNINIGGATYPATSQAPAGIRPILPMVKPLPYIENFNAALTLPIDWLSSPAMSVSATHGNSSSNGLYKNLWSSATSCNAITPPVGVIVAGTQLDFDYRIVDYTSYPATATTLGVGDNVDILVSTDGVVYNSIASINNGNHVSSNAFLTKTYSLAAYIGQTIYVKFAATWATGDYYLDIDNVSIYSPSNMVYTSSTTTQGVVTTVNAGTTSQQVIGIQVVATNNLNPINITKFAINGTGTTNVADISNAKLWSTGTSATFATTTQFGSTIAAPTTASFDITGALALSQGINYFWLTYDVPTTATNNNVIDAQCTGLTVGGADYVPTVTIPVGTRTIVNKTISAITITQAAVTDVVSGGTGKDILRVQFNVAGPATGTLNLNSLKVTSLNISDADIAASGVKLYNTLTSTTFATTTQLGTSQSYAASSATFSGLNYNLPTGNTYIWVAYDIAASATSNNTVDAKIVANDINVGGTTYPATDQSPAGLRTIKAPLAGIVTVGTAGNYPTLTNTGGIFEAINTYGLSGNLTINIISDLTEPGTVGLNNITETGAGGYTVTIQPSAAVNRNISGTYAGALIRFSGADRVTVDGSFSGNGQYLTFSNANTGSSNNTIAYSGTANNNTIKNCKVYSKYRSITTTAADNTLIEGNDIYGDVAGNTNTSQAGIYISSTSINTKIRRNTIHDYYYTGTSGWGCYGIYYGAEATTVTEISNNAIYSIKADGDASGVQYTPSGVYISSGGNIQIYYNSINLNGATLTYSSGSKSAGITVNTGVTLLDVRNNVITNSQTGNAANKTYAIYSYSAATALTTINNNDYYVTGVTPNIGYITSDRANLSAWQTATGQDAASISADPLYTSATNLMPTTGSPLSYAGVNIATVTTSINNIARTNPSDIGAYQFSVCPATSTFTGTGNWSDAARWNNGVPGPCTQVTISGACTVTSNSMCTDLTISPANSLTVNVGQTLNVSGQFTIKSTAAGTGSYINNGTVVNALDVKVERYLAASKWHLVSSPITNALSGIYLNIWLRAYNEATNTYGAYITPTTIPMPVCQGFSVWTNTANEVRTYTGTLNDGPIGPISAQLTGAASSGTGWNLVGNPYPSAIDWNAATGWTKTNIGSTIYLWNSTQYATYNGIVGVNGGSQYIPIGQGFFVQATAAGANFSINNNARLHNPVGFMKNEPNDVIRIKVVNNEFSDEAIVMLDASAMDEYDFKIDAAKLRGSTLAPQLYTNKSDTVETAICGYNSIQKVFGKYVYLEPASLTEHTLSYSQTIQGSQIPLLLDRVTQTIIYPNVPYVFTPATGDPVNRFQFIEQSGVGVATQTEQTLMIWESGNKLYISNLGEETLSDVKIFDMEGRLVFEGNQAVTDLNNLSRAMYLVRTTTNKQVVVKKIMIK